ncbi:hypothetical protein E8E11_007208 [Didymella keratinophila]|nr:hypothetical protein E8E11_007208 [Didymella keratinophila]
MEEMLTLRQNGVIASNILLIIEICIADGACSIWRRKEHRESAEFQQLYPSPEGSVLLFRLVNLKLDKIVAQQWKVIIEILAFPSRGARERNHLGERIFYRQFRKQSLKERSVDVLHELQMRKKQCLDLLIRPSGLHDLGLDLRVFWVSSARSLQSISDQLRQVLYSTSADVSFREARVDVVPELPAEEVDMIICGTVQLEAYPDDPTLNVLMYNREEAAGVLGRKLVDNFFCDFKEAPASLSNCETLFAVEV